MSLDSIDCPYCDKENLIETADWTDGNDFEVECPCGKKFMAHGEISVNWTGLEKREG